METCCGPSPLFPPDVTRRSPLRDELKILGKYADIMQERFEGGANVQWRSRRYALVLRRSLRTLLLQPLRGSAFAVAGASSGIPSRCSFRCARLASGLAAGDPDTGSTLNGHAAAFSDEGPVCALVARLSGMAASACATVASACGSSRGGGKGAGGIGRADGWCARQGEIAVSAAGEW